MADKMNDHTRYKKVAKKYSQLQGGGGGSRGFRLIKYPKLRFSVERLRARFVYFFRFLSRWSRGIKNCSSNSKMSLIGMRREGRFSSSSSSCSPTTTNNRYNQRLRSFGRSNSFYSEAIADCLEFIKTRSSSNISVDEHQACPR